MFSGKKAFFAVVFALASCATTESKQESKKDLGSLHLSQPNRKLAFFPERSREDWNQDASSTDPQKSIPALLALSETKAAQNIIRQQLEKTPNSPALLRYLGVAYAMEKNFSMAGYYADLVLQTESGDGTALNLKALSVLFRASGKLALENALEVFQQGNSAGANSVAIALNLGEFLLQMGRPAESLEVFAAVKDRCRNCAQALYGEGVAAARSGNLGRAESSLSSLIKDEPEHFRARFQLALVYKRTNRSKAIAMLQGILGDPKLKEDQVRQRANALLRLMNSEGS